jgi:sensor c-di-GMP phosphodiesterase-like protein
MILPLRMVDCGGARPQKCADFASAAEGGWGLPSEVGLFERMKAQGWRGLLIPAVFMLTFLAVIAPIIVALLIAHHQSFAAEREKAQSLAAEVLRRADIARWQLDGALNKLEAPPAHEPCSDESIRRMAGAALEYEQLQGAGYIKDDRLLCTAAGRQVPPLALGKAEFHTIRGYGVRPDVKLPFAPDVGLIIISAPSGYAFFLHPKLTLDLALGSDREAIGVIGVSRRGLINQRGPVDTKLLQPFFQSGRTTFVIHDRLVSVLPSKAGDYAGFAILPMDEVDAGIRRYLMLLLPIGLICGGGLVLLLRIMVRAENSFATIARRALRSDEFYLRYQPLVELATGRWIGAEALVRWRRATGEELRPDLFIPYLEEAGLIPDLTDKVFALLAADVGGDLAGRDDFYVSINLAATDLRGDRLAGLVDGLLTKTGCAARHFAIEATERGLIDAEDGNQALQGVRDRGLRVALDDFGTGYSSLAYLQKFPLDYIKIDRSFVDSIATGAATSSVVVHIINMAQDLRLGLIAEGVETEEQAGFLAQRGVAYGQGWLFARPMPWAQLIAGLDGQQV